MPRRARGQLRKDILDVVTQLLMDTGSPDAVSIDAVVARVGCTAPALYYYFPTKRNLLREACEAEFAQVTVDLDGVRGAPDPGKRIFRRGVALLRWARVHPGLYRVLFMSPESVADLDATPWFADPGIVELRQDIVAGIEAGALRPIDPDLAALALWGLIHGYASQAVNYPEIPIERLESALRLTGGSTVLAMLNDPSELPVP